MREHDQVRAVKDIVDLDSFGKETKYADKGEIGVVLHTSVKELPTVHFLHSRTITIVHPDEVEVVCV
jgi:hypothetical protein